METSTYTNDTNTNRVPRTRRTNDVSAEQSNIPKTPENELMPVEEYFGILHGMVDEYYDSIQG